MTSGRSICTRCAAPGTITSRESGSAAAISSEFFTGVSMSRSPQAISVGIRASTGSAALSSCTSRACRNATRVSIGVSWIIASLNCATLGLIFSSPKDAVRRMGRSSDRVAPRVRWTSFGA